MADVGSRVLIVDDNKVNRLLLCRSVELLGHRTATAENGRVALEKLRAESFDLMLMDVEMPELNGFELLEALSKDLKLRDLPVIVTSSLEDVTSVARCIELGAEDYLHKPVNQMLMKARVGASLEKKRLRDQQKELVRRFATSEVADDLAQSGFALGGRHVDATILFCDIRGFTSLAESLPPDETIELLNTYYTLMFDAINSAGGIVNQIIGDGLMAIFGAPLPLADHGRCAVRAGLEMLEMIELFSAERQAVGKQPIRIGIGIASGPLIAGYTGTQTRATYTCVGDTVNLAARLEAHTKLVGRGILIDRTTNNAIAGGDIASDAIGKVVFPGKTIAIEVFAVG